MPADEVGDGTGGAAAVAAPSPVTLLEQAQRRASELEAALAKKSAELEQVKSQHSAEEAQMRSVLTENQVCQLWVVWPLGLCNLHQMHRSCYRSTEGLIFSFLQCHMMNNQAIFVW